VGNTSTPASKAFFDGSFQPLATDAFLVETLFCEVDNLQVLCKTCHDEKTKLEKQLKTKKK